MIQCQVPIAHEIKYTIRHNDRYRSDK